MGRDPTGRQEGRPEETTLGAKGAGPEAGSENPGPAPEAPGKGSRGWRLLFGVAVLLAVGFLVVHRSEGAELVALVREIEPRWLLLAIVLQALTYVADARVWAVVLAKTGERQRFSWLVDLALAKFFVDQFVPTGGVSGTILVIRSLEKGGVRRSTSMAALVVRMASYYLAYGLCLAAAMVIADRAGHVPDLVFAIGVTMIALFVLVPATILWSLRVPGRSLPTWFDRLLGRRPFRRLGPTIRAMREASPAFVRDLPLLGRAIGLQLAVYLLDAGTLWIMLYAVGVETSFWVSFAGFMLGFLAGSAGIPGGVGAVEAATVGGLNLMGVPAAPALAATLLFRGWSLWLPLLPGFVYARRESWR